MNWTQIIIAVVSVIFTVISGLLAKTVIPWLQDKQLYEAAIVAVEAAEALYGRYHGDEKLKKVLNDLDARGYDIEDEVVLDAIHSAWKNLNWTMIQLGEKHVETPAAEE